MEGPEIKFVEVVIDNSQKFDSNGEQFPNRVVRFETGRLAQQAAGSTMAYLDDGTALLSATAVGKEPRDQLDFFPLTVDVEERMYAVGKIPGSFFRREGRPSTEAILTSRLIDRPLRPSFVSGLRNEVQVVVTVLSINPDDFYDVLAINAASLSTQISGLPFSGPVGGVRMSLINDQWVAFPKHSQLENSVFNMVVAGKIVEDVSGSSDVAIMMVEAEATDESWNLIHDKGFRKPTEEVVSEGLEAAKPFIKVLVEGQLDLVKQVNKPALACPVFSDYAEDVYKAVQDVAESSLSAALFVADKKERELALDKVKVEVLASLGETFAQRESEVLAAVRGLTKQIVRWRILKDQIRIDGRGLTDIRPLIAEVAVLPRVHGSAIFERGETQILGVTTLNKLQMEQQLDSLSPITRKRYMHNYNFPPYSTGEVGRVGSPKRREIGHGSLAERALAPVLPSREEFSYAIRQVSEALGSNGSTSMGSVCASTLSMYNAGVPLRSAVAGIAMGLVSDVIDGQKRYAALTDILGAEDAFGDMDFKVAGTADFVTAIQLDTKLDGLPAAVLDAALMQAREARLHILGVLNDAINRPDDLSEFAPRIMTVTIPVDKIGEVIGPKGKMINQIQEKTGADINIEDDGKVYISASSVSAADGACAMISAIVNPQLPAIGEKYFGTVVKITPFGAFVSLTPGKDGLLHVSEMRKMFNGKRVDNVEDVVSMGQKVHVCITKIDERGKLSLSPVLEGSV